VGELEALERNTIDFLLELARPGGAEALDLPGVASAIGGSPIGFHNAVIPRDLSEDDADAAITTSIAAFDRHRVPGTWHVGPNATPSDLVDRLRTAGFLDGGDDLGMVLPLDQLEAPPIVDGVAIAPVGPDDLGEWVEALASGFGEAPIEGEWAGRMLQALAFAPASPWTLWSARTDGAVVATALEFRTGDIAGIWFVYTRPNARRRGIGAGITAAALLHARATGAVLGVLGASTAGAAVYGRLGFTEVGRIRLFERPAPADGGTID
jgi:GNAT superfamily N-acetyltransferase